MRFDVTTLGEIMLRLSVPPGSRLETATQLDMRPGGAEANLAALLARLGRRTAWIGGLPDNALGRLAANHLRMAGVDLCGCALVRRRAHGDVLRRVRYPAAPDPGHLRPGQFVRHAAHARHRQLGDAAELRACCT